MENTKLKYAFIIPYRNRSEHKHFFDNYMKYILEDYDKESYLILYIHQKNDLPFNRGAMKNMGFVYVKKNYPKIYKNMNFIFNDIDTVPYKKNLLDYETKQGTIKHFFGFNFALGGIFSIKGKDFEDINGFPNYWNWGFEDNVIHKRALKHNIKIDRSKFYKVGSHKILHFCDAISKTLDSNILNTQFNKKYVEVDGLSKLKNQKFEKDKNENMVHVYSFDSYYHHTKTKNINYPVTNGSFISNPNKQNSIKTLLFN